MISAKALCEPKDDFIFFNIPLSSVYFSGNNKLPHHYNVKYVDILVLAQITCCAVCKLASSEQEFLHHYKVCNIEAAIRIDITYGLFGSIFNGSRLKNELLTVAAPVFPLADICAVIKTYLINVSTSFPPR